MVQSWKVSLPCTRAEAEALKEDIGRFAALESPPVLVTSEAQGEGWRLDAYFEGEPDGEALAQLKALVPSAGDAEPRAERVADADWVSVSRQGLAPIRAARFYVHTPAHRGRAPPGSVPFEIDAGRAFGTGHHETTAGCLIALDRLRRRGASFSDVLDLGTGTGLLAFAALRLWPAARATASDVDPVAVEVAAANAAANAVTLGRTRGRLALVTADGLDHPTLAARAPYDLVLANILAGPLVALAPAVARALAPGGLLVLAGLLQHQAERVIAAYRIQRLAVASSIRFGDWPTLVLRKRGDPARLAGRLRR